MMIDPALDTVAKSYVHNGELSEEHNQIIRESNGDAFKLKAEKEIIFLEKMDMGSQVSFGLNIYFSFKLFEYYENHIVYPAHEKIEPTKVGLREIAEKHNMNWILNIPKIEFNGS